MACITYHIYIDSLFGFILESILFVSEITGIFLDKRKLKHEQNYEI